MKYKVGDKVRIRKDLVVDKNYGGCYVNRFMEFMLGEECEIIAQYIGLGLSEAYYGVKGSRFYVTDEMIEEKIETKVEEKIETKVEEKIETQTNIITIGDIRRLLGVEVDEEFLVDEQFFRINSKLEKYSFEGWTSRGIDYILGKTIEKIPKETEVDKFLRENNLKRNEEFLITKSDYVYRISDKDEIEFNRKWESSNFTIMDLEVKKENI